MQHCGKPQYLQSMFPKALLNYYKKIVKIHSIDFKISQSDTQRMINHGLSSVNKIK